MDTGLIFRIVVVLITAFGCVPTLLDIKRPGWVAPVLLTLLGVLVAAVCRLDLRAWRRSRPASFRNAAEIRQFMQEWISQEGRVTIYTRDMSWVHDEQRTFDLLRAKAERKELCICLPEEIDVTRALAGFGATVHTYGTLATTPAARFTIVRHGRQDAQVAIGRSVDGTHTISTFSLGHDPAFGIASDLVELVAKFDAHERTAH